MSSNSEAHSKLVHDILLEHGANPRLVLWNQKVGAAKVRDAFLRWGIKGHSDIMGFCWPLGKFIAFEVKTGKAGTTPEQRDFLDRVNELGGCGRVIRHIDDARAILAELLRQ